MTSAVFVSALFLSASAFPSYGLKKRGRMGRTILLNDLPGRQKPASRLFSVADLYPVDPCYGYGDCNGFGNGFDNNGFGNGFDNGGTYCTRCC